MRQDAIVQADDEDRAELQALGRMQRQQRGGIDVVLNGVLIGDQCDIFKEVIQRAGGILQRQAAQLLDILPAICAFLRIHRRYRPCS